MLHVISLGAGVQSSTMALMAAAGEITPMPDCAIFADTHHEPRAVYEWLEWLTPKLPFPVHRVSKGDLWKAATTVRRTKDGQRTYIKTGIPIFFTSSEGGLTTRKGIGKRHCTRDFKVDVINRKVKELVGLKRASKSTPVLATTWIGISADEASRATTPSRKPWITKRYPLLELDMDRADCLEWMSDHGYPTPPRSACIFCPFHDDNSWLALDPEELFRVAAMEKQIQTAYKEASAIKGVPYFHESRVPILQVKFQPTTKATSRQRRLFGAECEGMCGV